jgi:hypothetical protein
MCKTQDDEDHMAMLMNYTEFLQRVEELGFMALSRGPDGFPSLSDETPAANWHTGDRETDPWVWKDRAAQEKRAAYGCILGGNKGFISGRFYAAFYAACHSPHAMQDRWLAGEINQTTWQLWQLFQHKSLLTTSEVRREMGVTASKGASRVDSAVVMLQKEFILTIAGSRKKVSKAGREYGWANNTLDRVVNWAPDDWLSPASGLKPADAQAFILDSGLAIGQKVNRAALAAYLGFNTAV